MIDFDSHYDLPRPTEDELTAEHDEARAKLSAATRVAGLVVDIHTVGDVEVVLATQSDEALYGLVADMSMLQHEGFDVSGAYALTPIQFSELYALADTLAAQRLSAANLTETTS